MMLRNFVEALKVMLAKAPDAWVVIEDERCVEAAIDDLYLSENVVYVEIAGKLKPQGESNYER